MRHRFVPFIALFLVLFGGINYYVGLRGWQWVATFSSSPVSAWIYWVLFLTASFAFVLARLTRRVLPRAVTRPLGLLGAYWMLVLIYSLLLLLVIDAARGVDRWLPFLPGGLAAVQMTGAAVVALLVVGMLYGLWRARTPVVVRYEITVPKRGGAYRDLHVALVSDTHLGTILGTRSLRRMVAMVNGLEPDLILHAGDLIDDDLSPFIEQGMAAELRQLRAPLGTYAVLGNHDYPAGHPEFRRQLEQAGIRLLVDEWVLVADSFYLIGREDLSGGWRSGRARKPLEQILAGVDRSRPLILMDHQPSRLAEARQAGIDLQVSGHTHRGQMFPNQFITRRVFEVDWGYLYKEGLHLIVSLGFGTWGPPIRIGNRPEVVSIRVKFAADTVPPDRPDRSEDRHA